jgi:4a-hydroxytetrahydrobiopterin dehydratase
MSWIEKEGTLQKDFKGDSFSDLCAKLQQVAEVADGMDHHPDFTVSGYKHIHFELMTHSEGKVTEKDHDLAMKLDDIFG